MLQPGIRHWSPGEMPLDWIEVCFAGHGIGRSILEWSEGLVAASGRRRARLDCVEDNQALRAYYEAAGYAFAGNKSFPDLDWAGATARYEKQLRS
jgi:hypothetical protein